MQFYFHLDSKIDKIMWIKCDILKIKCLSSFGQLKSHTLLFDILCYSKWFNYTFTATWLVLISID